MIKQTLLNPAFHREIVNEQVVVNKINADLPALFFNIGRSSDISGQPGQVPEATIGNLIRSVLPADWVAGQVEGLIQRGIDFIESGQESFAVMIDLTTIKQSMNAKANEMAETVIEGMPKCTGKDVLGYLDYVLTGDNGSYPYCMPPKPFDTLVRTAIVNSFYFMTQKMPDNISIVTISLDNATLRPLATVLRIARIMAQVYRIAPYVILGLLLVLILINLKNLRIAILGTGFALLCSGISIFLIMLGIHLYGRSLNLAEAAGASIIPLSPALVAGYVKAVFTGVEEMLWKLGAALAGVGLCAILGVWITRRTKHADESITAM